MSLDGVVCTTTTRCDWLNTAASGIQSDGEAEADSRSNLSIAYGLDGLGENARMTGEVSLASIVIVFPSISLSHLHLTINQYDV